MAMFGNLVATLKNVVTALDALDGKMTIMETLFANLVELIGQHTSNIHNKFILCPKNKISIASFICHICLCIEKKLNFLANDN